MSKAWPQVGAVLVASLIVLVVVTLLLLQSMQSSSMQVLMAGHFSDHVEALANAENTLKQGEYRIRQLQACDHFDSDLSDALGSDLYDQIWRQIDWSSQAHATGYGHYVIQHLATLVAATQQPQPTGQLLMFKITVRATSNNGKALVYIESVYNHASTPLAEPSVLGRRSWQQVRI